MVDTSSDSLNLFESADSDGSGLGLASLVNNDESRNSDQPECSEPLAQAGMTDAPLPPPLTPAKAPFNDGTSGSDIIIVTSDHYAFHAHKAILAMASPFFKDMLSLNQPIQESSPQLCLSTGEALGLPIIPVSEDSTAMDFILRACYPVSNAKIKIDNAKQFEVLLNTAVKYEIDVAAETLVQCLRSSAGTQPLQVYLLACRFDLEEEARMAAETWQRKVHGFAPQVKLGDTAESFEHTFGGACYTADMSAVSSGHYYRLVEFVRRQGAVPPDYKFTTPPQTLSFRPAVLKTTLEAFPFIHPDTNFFLRSRDEILFPVHAQILDLASESGQCRLLARTPSALCDERDVLELDYDGALLLNLIRLCYPGTTADFEIGIDKFCAIVDAAQALDLPKAIPVLRKHFQSAAASDPLGAYFVAARLRWEEQANFAAKKALLRKFRNDYSPFMEDVKADVYHALLKYAHKVEEIWCQIGASSTDFTDSLDLPGSVVERAFSSLVDRKESEKVLSGLKTKRSALQEKLAQVKLELPDECENIKWEEPHAAYGLSMMSFNMDAA